VRISIYDVQGRMVRSFAFGAQSAGIQRLVWNGANDQGVSLASGVYIYRVKASSLERGRTFDKSAKMILLK
jgi:flagellar hook assembly protein FlgD